MEGAIANFFLHSISGKTLPGFDWTGLQEGSFTVVPESTRPLGAKLWQAANPVNRDFRFTGDPTAPQWTATPLAADATAAGRAGSG